jgi:hypothetical protein
VLVAGVRPQAAREAPAVRVDRRLVPWPAATFEETLVVEEGRRLGARRVGAAEVELGVGRAVVGRGAAGGMSELGAGKAQEERERRGGERRHCCGWLGRVLARDGGVGTTACERTMFYTGGRVAHPSRRRRTLAAKGKSSRRRQVAEAAGQVRGRGSPCPQSSQSGPRSEGSSR